MPTDPPAADLGASAAARALRLRHYATHGSYHSTEAALRHDVKMLLAAYDAQTARLAAVEARLRQCRNCGQFTGRALCERCRAYQRRTGRQRPPGLEPLIRHWLPRAGLTCSVCHERPVWAQGRCGRCYQYWHRTGRERFAIKAGAVGAGEARDVS